MFNIIMLLVIKEKSFTNRYYRLLIRSRYSCSFSWNYVILMI